MSLFARPAREVGLERRSSSYQDVWGTDREFWSGDRLPTMKAARLSTVWSCVRLIGTAFAQIPWNAYREDSKEPIRPAPQILERPSGLVLPSAWRFQAAASLALWGNAYGRPTGQDRLGYPTGVEWLDPDQVKASVQAGRKVYTYGGKPSPDLFHVMFQPLPGLVTGTAPLEEAGLVELGREAQQFARRWFTEGATPSAILYSDQELEPEESRKLADTLFNRLRRRRRPVVLGSGLKYEQVSVAANESQFLETIRENRAEIAVAMGVPPELVGGAVGGSSVTYANREQRSIDLLTYCVNGYLVAMQDALSTVLPRGQVARPVTAAFLRSDTLARYQAHEIGIRARILTPNEARDVEDRVPLPDGDQFPLLPGQQATPTPADPAPGGSP